MQNHSRGQEGTQRSCRLCTCNPKKRSRSQGHLQEAQYAGRAACRDTQRLFAMTRRDRNKTPHAGAASPHKGERSFRWSRRVASHDGGPLELSGDAARHVAVQTLQNRGGILYDKRERWPGRFAEMRSATVRRPPRPLHYIHTARPRDHDNTQQDSSQLMGPWAHRAAHMTQRRTLACLLRLLLPSRRLCHTQRWQ